MNFIAGFLLLAGFDERSAYELLAIIVEKMMPADYFSEQLFGLHVDQEVMQDVLKNQLPRLATHLRKQQIPTSLATMNWLLTGFVAVLPTHVALRVWDLFFFHGQQALFWTSLALFKLMEDSVLHMNNSGEIYTTVSRPLFFWALWPRFPDSFLLFPPVCRVPPNGEG